MRDIGQFLNLLNHVKTAGQNAWIADCPCPSHNTPQKHLSVKLLENKILVKCFGADTAEDIVAALHIELADLFINPQESTAKTQLPPAKIIAEYNYEDENRNLLYQVVRYEPKAFKQRHRNGNGEWSWNMDGVKRVLYHLPDILQVQDETIYHVEGEKDADSLWGCGQVATTSPGGASNWKPEYADYLKGKHVCIIPDKDAPGYAYAKQVVKSLEGKASSIRVILLDGEGKDISDWLANGGDPTLLESMQQDISALFQEDKPRYQSAEDSIIWQSGEFKFQAQKLSEERTGIHARVSLAYREMPLSWSYLNIERREDRSSLASAAYSTVKGDVTKTYAKEDMRQDLDKFCLGLWDYHLSQFVPEDVPGQDPIVPLRFCLYPYILDGGGTILFAAPGRGKSYTALLWAISIDAGCNKFWQVQRRNVLFINLERSKESLQRRISLVNKVLGLPATRPLYMLNARGKNLIDVLPACRKAIKQRNVGLVVLDSISRTGVGDLTGNIEGNKVVDALSSMCPSWLALAHSPRQNDNHMFGSIMQDAGADICIQLNSQIKEGILGVGYQITKQNDVGSIGQVVWAFEFDEVGFCNLRRAKMTEFVEVEGRRKEDIETTIIEWLIERDSGEATATEVEENLGFNRAIVSKLFHHNKAFQQTRKEGRNVFYGVAQRG